MVSVGLIAYSNRSGLGQMARALREQGLVHSQMVIRHPLKGTEDLGNFPHTYADLNPTLGQLTEYLQICNPDIIIIIETPFNFKFLQKLYHQKRRVILIPMIDSVGQECFQPHGKYISRIIHPTRIGSSIYNKTHYWNGDIIHIPWPIDTSYFNPGHLGNQSNICTFLHNEGFGGAGYRKGTDMVFTAFQQLAYVEKAVTLYVRSQCAESQHSQIRKIPKVTIDFKDIPEAIDIYRGGSVYVAPSRREGLGLPIPEAMACGLPVITTGAPPMNQWFMDKDRSLFVSIASEGMLEYGDVPMYECSVYDLMKKMKFATKNLDLMAEIGQQNCKIIQDNFSWAALKTRWEQAIQCG